jgi:hypothetical protein
MPAPANAKAPGQDDLFSEEVPLLLPARFAVEGKVVGSATRQQDVSAMQTVCRLKPFAFRRVSGFETILKSGETQENPERQDGNEAGGRPGVTRAECRASWLSSRS